ncbi:DUF551 domain-containing protein [Klebsiella pneumoniae]|nr:DUF551 domain-containing protein [Klebsiella pneumoniae]HBT1506146.1 DUF551 domain-containing protein [Klebsiella pneumoniae]
MKFEEWLSQQNGVIEVDCGCVTTEAFYHWMRVAYEAGNFSVVPDGYVLVPIEPTEAMCDISHIGVDVYCGITDDNEYYSIGGAEAAKVWKAMLAAAPQPPVSERAIVPGKWIPVSERMPIEFEAVIAFDGDQVYGEAMYSSDDGFTIDGYEPCDRLNLQNVTHWMPLPAAPQEVKGE